MSETALQQRLITYHDAIVPWVARWTGEKTSSDAVIGFEQVTGPGTSLIRVRYNDEQPFDRPFGDSVLVFREQNGRGGKPEFGAVHARRQMNCMRTPRCQVCGRSLKGHPGGTPWLFSEHQIEILESWRGMTINPPTCLDCMPLAIDLCPHVRQSGWRKLLVKKFRPVAYDGDLYDITDPSDPKRQTQAVAFGRPHLHMLIAKQLMVHVEDYEEVS